jgi:hypothetical protein
VNDWAIAGSGPETKHPALQVPGKRVSNGSPGGKKVSRGSPAGAIVSHDTHPNDPNGP